MSDTTSGAPAGWYPDPKIAATQRYWDGLEWTLHTAPAAANAPRVKASSNLTFALAIFVAVVFPIVGVFWGLVEIDKKHRRQGSLMIALSVVAFVVYAILLTR